MRRRLLALLLLAAAAGGVWLWQQGAPRVPPPSEERLAALRQRRQALQERFRELTASQEDQALGGAPAAGLLIGIPTSFTTTLIDQLVTGLFSQVRVRLRDQHVRVSDDVRGKVLFGMRTFGRFDLDVDVAEVSGELRPGAPRVVFARQRIAVTLPIRLVEGHGRANLHLQWDSRGLANAICGDIDVRRDFSGSVAPRAYRVSGSFELGSESGAIVLTPRFPDLKFRLRVRPDAASWRAVDQLVDDQSALCRTALRKVDVHAKLEELVGRGFEVKLPARLLRPIRLPAGVQQSLRLQGIDLALDLTHAVLSVSSERLWYGVDVQTRRAQAR